MEKYLSEAKSAVEGSESKEKLLEAIENLGNALKEKLGWILSRTSEVSSISSLVIALLQTYTGT